MTRSVVTVCSWNSPAPFKSRKHWTSYLQICVCQTIRSTKEFVDWCRNVCILYKHVCDTSRCDQRLKQHLTDTWASMSQNVFDKAVGQWRKRLHATSLWTSAKLKPVLFRANTLHNWLLIPQSRIRDWEKGYGITIPSWRWAYVWLSCSCIGIFSISCCFDCNMRAIWHWEHFVLKICLRQLHALPEYFPIFFHTFEN